MEILSWVVYGIATVGAISWVFGIRHKVNYVEGVTIQTVNTTLLFLVSIILIPILGISPFHVIWMFIVSLMFGAFSLVFPFSLLSIFGNMLATIVCVGLDREAIAERQTRLNRLRDVMISERLTAEEAKEKLIEMGEWQANGR